MRRWDRWLACALWGAATFGVVGCGTSAVPGDAASEAAADAAGDVAAEAAMGDAAAEAAMGDASAEAATGDASAAQFACGPTERCTVGTQVCRTQNRPGACPAMPTPDNCRPGCMGCPALPDPTCVAVPPSCAATPTCDCVVGALCTSMPGLTHACTAAGGGLALQCTSPF